MLKRNFQKSIMLCLMFFVLLLTSALPVLASGGEVSSNADSAISEAASGSVGLTEKDLPTVENPIEYKILYYKDGFFGYGEEGDFKQWSAAHFIPIIVCIAVILLIYRYRRQLRNWKHEETLRLLYIAFMLLVEMGYFWRLIYVGPGKPAYTMLTFLPFQICQWTLLITCFMMAKKSEFLFSFTFFTVNSFGMMPLVFPAVISTTGPGYFRYYQFWGEHILPIIACYYMMFVFDFKPKLRRIYLTYLFLWPLLPIAMYLNTHVPTANFLYLSPAKLEMLSFLPNDYGFMIVLYLAVSFVLALLIYFIYSRVVKISEKLRAKKTAEHSGE